MRGIHRPRTPRTMQARAGKENHDAWPRLARLPETNSRMRQKGRQTSKSFMGTPEAARAGRRGLRAQNGSGNGVLASKAAACGKRRRCVCSCAFHGARHSPPCIHPFVRGSARSLKGLRVAGNGFHSRLSSARSQGPAPHRVFPQAPPLLLGPSAGPPRAVSPCACVPSPSERGALHYSTPRAASGA